MGTVWLLKGYGNFPENWYEMKNLKLWIFFTSVHWVTSETVAADDILAMLQNTVRVNAHGQETAQIKIEERGVPDMKTISRLEEIVMAKLREGAGGNNNLTATINASIKQMYTAILAETKANQKRIIDDIKAFSVCKAGMWKSYYKTIPVEKEFWILGKIYPKCLNAERKLNVVKTKNYKVWRTVRSTLKTKQKLFYVIGKSCGNVCNQNRNENYNEQLDRLSKYYTKCRKQIGPKHKDVVIAKKRYKLADKSKRVSNARYLAMKKKCELIAYRMNKKKCDATGKFLGACAFYEACWKRAKRTYDQDSKRIKIEEANMEVQWRALIRIQCYLNVLDTKNDKNKKKEEAQLKVCIGIKKKQLLSRSRLATKIDYKRPPRKPKCPMDRWCPCTTAYLNYYYRGTKRRCVKNIVSRYSCPA